MSMLTDEQIMLLEQLTYLDPKTIRQIEEATGVNFGHEGMTVEEYLEEFDEEALEKLEKMVFDDPTAIKGHEWAAMFRAIKEDSQLSSTEIVDMDETVHAICFEDPEGNPIVAFRGTYGAREWEDDAYGLADAETQCQLEALEYIEGLPYDGNITVTGHSKGGNKAQFVTILSDKVTRCISMDGQGFSKEFLEKYRAEIQTKGFLITNYYIDGDYVNILMFPVPGAEQICIQSADGVVHLYYHISSSFYQYVQDENGNWVLKRNDDGSEYTFMQSGTRSKFTEYLQGLTYFFMNVMPEAQREEFSEYLGPFLALALCENARYEIDGVVYTHDDIMDYLLSNEEMFGLLIAYVLKYIETYNLSAEEIAALLVFLGIDDYLEEHQEEIRGKLKELTRFVTMNPILSLLIAAGTTITVATVVELIMKLLNEIRDGKDDPVIQFIINSLCAIFGIDIPADQIWSKIEKAYTEIPEFDPSTARDQGKSPECFSRDFTLETYETLIGCIDGISNMMNDVVNGWVAYSSEEWYGSLGIGNFIRGITAYINNSNQINMECKVSIQRVFDNAAAADFQNAGTAEMTVEGLRTLKKSLYALADNLG